MTCCAPPGNRPKPPRFYREVLKIDPRHANARLALAGIALADNKLADARSEVDAALKESPNNLQARYTQALIDFREKKTERARDHLAAVLKSAPNFVPALLLGGSIEYAPGNLQTAEAHLNKVVKAAPNNLYALRLLAASQLRPGRPDDAARTLAPALKSANQDLGVLLVVGEIALAKKDFAQASAYFEKAAQRILAKQVQQQHPDNRSGFVLEGDTAYARKDYPAALAAYERAHKLALSGALLVRQLQVFNATQRPKEGEKRIAAWLAANPQDAGTRALLAESLIRRKQYAAAAEHYLVLNKSNPGNLVVLNNLAWTLHESGDKRELPFAEQALKLQPENPAVLDTYGWLLVHTGNPAKGLDFLKKAQSKAPDVPIFNGIWRMLSTQTAIRHAPGRSLRHCWIDASVLLAKPKPVPFINI